MKRNNLTTAVVAGIAGMAGIVNLASAVDLNPDGLGQVLIYPYYTVNGGNQTLISVVNTTAVAKAVKVRFLEGHDSREVLDFNLFLSPFDVWTAGVFSLSATGAGNLVTNDNSCTAPLIKTNTGLPTLSDGRHYVAFRNIAYSGSHNDTGPETLARTREGHLEMIEMATLTGATATAVTHSASGTPPGCASVQSLSTTSTTLLPPSGGLFGSGSIVNAAQGVMNAYNADAIDGFFTLATVPSPLFTATSSLTPSLANANNSNIVAGSAVSYVFNNGTLIQSNWSLATSQGIDAVSAVYAANAIYNEYELEAAAGAESEWIVTFPTKRFYVDPEIATTTVIPPFVEIFGENTDDESCVVVGLSIYNREEATTTTSVDFSPPPTTPPSSLCYESQVVTMQRAADYSAASGVSRILGSTLTTNIDARALGFDAGWLRMDMDAGTEPHTMRASTDLDTFHGLPVTGYLSTNYTNTNVTPGVLANYSGLYRHRASRNCTNVGGACS